MLFRMKNFLEHSERLTYRGVDGRDRAALRAMLTDPAVTEPAGFLALKTDEEFEKFFESLDRQMGAFALLRGEELIGYLRVYPERTDEGVFAGKRCLGLGFVIGKAYQKQGYGTEMLNWITGYLRGKADYCFADAFLDNEASNRLIQKCGFYYVEDYSMYFVTLGKVMHLHSYVYEL